MSKNIELTHKPLVEAILDIKFILDGENGNLTDPYYQLLPGKFHDKVKDNFPYYEQMPAVKIPPEFAAYQIQHRFRAGKEKWPLVQFGPGVLTLNETKSYNWDSFQKNIELVVDAYSDVSTQKQSLKIQSIVLRYVDFIEIDTDVNILSFIKNELKTTVLFDSILQGSWDIDNPLSVDMNFTFNLESLPGALQLRLAKGNANGISGLVLETAIQSKDKDVPLSLLEIKQWVEDAHEIAHDWFFKLIDGALHERLK